MPDLEYYSFDRTEAPRLSSRLVVKHSSYINTRNLSDNAKELVKGYESSYNLRLDFNLYKERNYRYVLEVHKRYHRRLLRRLNHDAK